MKKRSHETEATKEIIMESNNWKSQDRIYGAVIWLCRSFMGKVGLDTISKEAIRPFSGKRDEATSIKEKNTHYCSICQIKATQKFKVVINKTPIY